MLALLLRGAAATEVGTPTVMQAATQAETPAVTPAVTPAATPATFPPAAAAAAPVGEAATSQGAEAGDGGALYARSRERTRKALEEAMAGATSRLLRAARRGDEQGSARRPPAIAPFSLATSRRGVLRSATVDEAARADDAYGRAARRRNRTPPRRHAASHTRTLSRRRAASPERCTSSRRALSYSAERSESRRRLLHKIVKKRKRRRSSPRYSPIVQPRRGHNSRPSRSRSRAQKSNISSSRSSSGNRGQDHEAVAPSVAATESVALSAAVTEAVVPSAAVVRAVAPSAAVAEAMMPCAAVAEALHPSYLMRAFDDLVRVTRAASVAFVASMRQGGFDGLDLSVPAEIVDAVAVGCRGADGLVSLHGVTARVLGGPDVVFDAAPFFALDPAKHALLLDILPPSVSVWDIREALEDCLGVVGVVMEPPFTRFGAARAGSGRRPLEDQRTALAYFASAATLGAARQRLCSSGGLEVRGGHRLLPAATSSMAAVPTVHVVSPLAAVDLDARVATDLHLAAEVITALNAERGVTPADTDAVLTAGDGDEPVKLLDLRLLYLRRVHHFCFYRAELFEDALDLSHRCGIACLRAQSACLQPPAAAAAAGAAAGAHEGKLRHLLARGAIVERPALPCQVDDEVLVRRLEEAHSVAAKDASDCFGCALCPKAFRGKSFLKKHLLKAHPDVVAMIRADVDEQRMLQAFRTG